MPFTHLSSPEISLVQMLDRMTAIALRIHQSSDLSNILHITLSEIREMLGSDRIVIYRFLPAGDGVVAEESVSPQWTPIQGQLIYDPCFNSKWIEQYRQGKIGILEDIDAKPLQPCYRELLTRLQIRANLVVPILVHNQGYPSVSTSSPEIWGLLIAHQCSSPRHWQPIEIKLLQQVAAQLGIAIEQKKLYHQLQQLNQQHLQAQAQQERYAFRQTETFLRQHNADCTCTETVFTHSISIENLKVFDRLQTPIWIFDIQQFKMWWANNAALYLWNAQSRAELLDRNFSDVSEATQIRLSSYLHRFEQGKTITENWTFYPDGKPVSVRCLCSGIQIEEGRMVMLVEGTTEACNQIDRETLRSLEAMRHTTLMISLYTMDGVALIQNPAAINCYGDTLHPNTGNENTFLRHFVDKNRGKQAIEIIKSGEVFSIEAQVFTRQGIRWHGIDIRCTRDPVTGERMILVNEKDITKQQKALEERKQAEQALHQQMERERMIYAIAQNIRRSLDLEQILNTTVAEVRQFLQTERVIIYRFNADWSGVVVKESVAEGWLSILNMETTDTYFVERQNQIYNPITIKITPDIYTAELDPCHLELLERLQVRSKIVVPILQGDYLWGLLVVHHCSAPRNWYPLEIALLNQLATQLAIAIHQSELHQQLYVANQKLHQLATIDQLTQIPNRHSFDQKLHQEWYCLLREQNPLSLLICDIDYFKQYNDTYGHPAGDTCLTMVAEALKHSVQRSTDLVARYGGEEFAVILPNTDSNGAMQVAQKIQAAITQLNIPHLGSAVKKFVTLSIGIATVIPTSGMVPLDLVEVADRTLYKAKSQGRNCSSITNLSCNNSSC